MSSLWLYRALSRWPGLSFRAKVMVVAFVGTHIPLLALLGYFLLAYQAELGTALLVMAVALASTLVGTGITLAVLAQLLRPVKLTAEAFRAYLDRGSLPELPTRFGDEVGHLMADTVHVLRKLDRTIDELAFYDHATGLPNREAAVQRVGTALGQLRGGDKLGAIVLRLNEAGAVKGSHGGAALDRVMRQLADRWQRRDDNWVTVARLREDTLLGVLRVSAAEAGQIAARLGELMEGLDEGVDLGGQVVHPGFLTGVALAPDDADEAEALVERAETAMTEAAKQEDATGLAFFSPDLPARVAARMALARDLREALGSGDLALHYQPVVGPEGEVFGAEALVRWHHPQRGWVSPGEFVPVAESQGLVTDLSNFVLEAGTRQLGRWGDANRRPAGLSVNLSARDLHDPDLPERVASALGRHGIQPQSLQLEVTETAALIQPERSVETLGRLSAMGISLAIDDFGTGYSSLAYLRQLPWDKLKIDRTFVQGVDADPDNHTLCQSMVSLATAFGREVIAEGVETEAERQTLTELGCRRFQGFLFAPALPPEEFGRWLGASAAT